VVQDSEVFETLWQQSVVGIAILDHDGRFLRANPAICRFLEFTEVELQGVPFEDITHPDDRAADLKMADEVRAGRASGYDMSKKYITKWDRVVRANLRVSPLLDGDGKFMAFLSQVAPASGSDPAHPEKPAERPGVPWAGVLKILAAAGTVVGAAILYLVEHWK
jgi:PAS domain S-box-containing protein